MDTDAERPLKIEDLVAALAGFFGGRQEKGDRLLKVEDLMDRWGVGQEVVLRHIKEDGLPFVPIGRSGGRRPQYRFRPSDVEKWEADRVRVRETSPTAAPGPAQVPGGIPAGWDGVDRTARGRKAGAKGRTA